MTDAQQATDPRVANIVQAGKVRVALYLPAAAISDRRGSFRGESRHGGLAQSRQLMTQCGHARVFALTVLDTCNVATHHSRASLVHGRSHPNGGVANRAIAPTRSRNLDFLGLRRTPRWVGDLSFYTFCACCGVPMGEASNGPVEGRFVDRRDCDC